MNAFDKNRYEEYEAEANARWGSSSAYAEYEKKLRERGEDKAALMKGMDELMGKFALCMKGGSAPESAEAQALVGELQGYITEHFYTCTEEILRGLGVMYTADERFRRTIDAHAYGTAVFIRSAIEARNA